MNSVLNLVNYAINNNTLEIKVVNSWFNRVAGDEMFPEKRNTTGTFGFDWAGNNRASNKQLSVSSRHLIKNKLLISFNNENLSTN